MAGSYLCDLFRLILPGALPGGSRRLGSCRAVRSRNGSRANRDIFFAHSTIVFGVVGVFLMLASLLWTMIDRYPGQNFFPTGKMLAMPLLNMFIAIAGSFIIIVLLARYLPRTSIYRRFALIDSNPPGPSLAGVPRQFATALTLTPGTQGTAVTVLRPSGKARFADHVVDVVTEGEFIAPQTPVTVIQTDGMRVVVKSAAEI